MRFIQSHARVFATLMTAMGAATVGGHANAADVVPAANTGTAGTIALNPMVLDVRAPTTLPIGKNRGTGSMDPVVTQVCPNKLLVVDTAQVQFVGNANNANGNGHQLALTVIELTKEGPKVVGQQGVPRDLKADNGNNAERVHVKPNLVSLDMRAGLQYGQATGAGLTNARVLLTYVSEATSGNNGGRQQGSEGAGNNNPQTMARVLTVSCAPSPTFATAALTAPPSGIPTDAGLLQLGPKVNTVSLTGVQDAQQYGAESVKCNGNVCTIAHQRNNNTTHIAQFTVLDDGTMQRTIQRAQNNQNGQHSRPVFAADFSGRTFEAIVETNDQPARNIRLWEISQQGIQTVKQQRIMQGVATNTNNTAQQLFVSRPYASMVANLSPDLDPAQKTALEAKSPVFTFAGVVAPVRNRNQVGGDNQNGHGGGATRTVLMSLDPGTLQPTDGTQRPALNQLPIASTEPNAVRVNAANYGRHASMITASAYGPVGQARPAAVLLSAPSTGSAVGYAQFVPYDATTGKFDVRANKNRFSLGYADIANATKGKRNPQDQAGSFLNGITDVVNPFYGDATAKQPEVKSYAVVPVNGAFNITGANADKNMGLRVTFIPQTWDPAKSVTPGEAKPVDSIPLGPAPVVPNATGGAGQPGGDAPGTGDGEEGEETGDENDGSGTLAGGLGGGATSGCSVGATGSSAPFGGLALLGLGLAALVGRRRKEQG